MIFQGTRWQYSSQAAAATFLRGSAGHLVRPGPPAVWSGTTNVKK